MSARETIALSKRLLGRIYEFGQTFFCEADEVVMIGEKG